MSAPAVIQNFRGARALVIFGDDANCASLTGTLRRLGLGVSVVDPGTAPGAAPCPASHDIVFFDADEEPGPAFADKAMTAVPCVAVIGHEAPSRLVRVVRRRCASHLMKPVRPAGVYTALVLALNEQRARARHADERAALSNKVDGRRFVTKAIVRIMQEEGIDDDEAFRRLRMESMRRRVSIEALARDWLLAGLPAARGRCPRVERPANNHLGGK